MARTAQAKQIANDKAIADLPARIERARHGVFKPVLAWAWFFLAAAFLLLLLAQLAQPNQDASPILGWLFLVALLAAPAKLLYEWRKAHLKAVSIRERIEATVSKDAPWRSFVHENRVSLLRLKRVIADRTRLAEELSPTIARQHAEAMQAIRQAESAPSEASFAEAERVARSLCPKPAVLELDHQPSVGTKPNVTVPRKAAQVVALMALAAVAYWAYRQRQDSSREMIQSQLTRLTDPIPSRSPGRSAPVVDQRFDPKDFSGVGVEGGVAGGLVPSGDAVLSVDEVQEKPERLAGTPPVYPPLLQQAGIEGTVIVQAIIDTMGRVEPNSLRITQTANPGFNESAKQAVSKSLFRPARVYGKAVRVLIQIPISYTHTQSIAIRAPVWTETFESSATGSWPSLWISDANAADGAQNYVDNAASYAGGQSLRLFGAPDGCWSAITYRSMTVAPPFYLEVAIRNGNEIQTGCHLYRGLLQLRQCCTSTNPARQLLVFRRDGTVEAPDGETLATFAPLAWYTVRIKYERISSTQVALSYWVDGRYLGQKMLALQAEEDLLDHVNLEAGEGAVWFDEVRILR
jgi:TonB family protein